MAGSPEDGERENPNRALMDSLSGKRVTVYGLGRFGGGIAVSRWLADQGARVLVTDRDSLEKLAGSVEKLKGAEVELRLGEHRQEDFTTADLVVASPAIPFQNEYLQAARGAGVPITTEIRLFIERCPAKIIGVTGTKGKSTTTAMLGEILSTKFKTWVGGNIGKSLLEDLPAIGPEHLVLLELSSYMLEHLKEMRWSPHVALVTMILQDHLEWHGSYEAYIEAKQNIVRFQTGDDIAVLNEEDPTTAALARLTAAKTILFGLNGRKKFELLVPGVHNQTNAQGAFAAAMEFGIDWNEAQKALLDFPGLPHRLQLVHEENGVRFYDDSIATIPEAAIAALDSFPPKKVIQIIGGKDKGLPITVMCSELTQRAKAVLCIGETGREVSKILEQSPYQAGAAIYSCGDLATAVRMAKKMAAPGDVVLLSPGFASQDQFVNFEERGELFAKLVQNRPVH
jgi:UDP-N-acetylmuramoylalanine--D-glutamate ligase